MPIYEITNDHFKEIEATSFQKAKLKERGDLQRLLKTQIEIIAPNTLIIAEEFCEWEDSKRRIDLLGLDKNANLVVIELKATDDGSHMELQAIRYAAMVSAMTFEKAVDVYGDYLINSGSEGEPEVLIKEFLSWEEIDEDSFAQDVKIVLVSEDFSKEITTAVMWLNERNLDIRCIRIKPYKYGDRVLVDIQQVIPLPEAEEYQIRIKEKVLREWGDRADRETRHHKRYEFWHQLLESSKGKLPLFDNISPTDDGWIAAGSGKSGIHYQFDVRKHDASVTLILEGEKERNKKSFDFFAQHRAEIEKVFGSALEWYRSDELIKSFIRKRIPAGGYSSNTETWKTIHYEMIDMMDRLEKALSPYIQQLSLK